MTRDELLGIFGELTIECVELLQKKNQDYTNNSEDIFANLNGSVHFNVPAEVGVLIRMMDKMKRIESFVRSGHLAVNDEKVRDSIVDIINYAVLVYAMIQSKSPPSPPKQPIS